MTGLVLALLGQIQFGGDAGVSYVRRIDCSGSGLNCSTNGTVGTIVASGGGSGAPTDATYWTGSANVTLSAEINLGALSTGLVLNTSGTPSAYAGSTCGASQYATSANASGVLNCSQVPASSLEGTISDSQLASSYSGVGTCTNQFVRGLNDNAAPTCASVANADISAVDASKVSTGTVATARLGSGTADSTTFLRGDQTWAAPGGGSDPWTYLTVNGGTDFTTTSNTAVNVTGLAFTPAANTKYEMKCMLLLRTATTTVNPRLGFAWSTGLTDGVVMLREAQAVNTVPLAANGNINAASLIAVGGLPNTTQSWPAWVNATLVAGSSPSGDTRVQLASETNGTTVTVKSVGSFCRWRTRP